MNPAWKTVRVFISSTFKDMHAERDHLVRFVFPRLREELLKRRIHLVDVDLRWGVTSDQDAFDLCMDEINRCHPRFICLLGGRYGWVPPPKAIPPDVFDAIMSGSSPAGILSADERVAVADLYALEAASGVYKLRGKPRATADVERYYALAEIAVSVFQRAELPEVRHSITSSEVHYGALDRLQEPTFRHFYFRDQSVTNSIPPPWAKDYREPPGSPGEQHLEELKTRIKDPQTRGKVFVAPGQVAESPLPWYEYPCQWDVATERLTGLKPFGDRVYADLLVSVDAEVGPHPPEKLDEFAEENAAMEAFIEERTERYIIGSRQPIFDQLRRHAEGTGGNGYLCLVGEPGSGKSALLAQFTRLLSQSGFGLLRPAKRDSEGQGCQVSGASLAPGGSGSTPTAASVEAGPPDGTKRTEAQVSETTSADGGTTSVSSVCPKPAEETARTEPGPPDGSDLREIPTPSAGIPQSDPSSGRRGEAKASGAKTGAIIIPHFVGASPGSTDVRRTLRRLCHELAVGTGITDEIPDDYEKLRQAFPAFLQKAAASHHIVILIDAINQFDASYQSSGMYWLPNDLPDNARIILSALPGPALESLRKRPQPPVEVLLPALEHSDAQAIIDTFLARYRKALEPAHRTALLSKTDSGTPLYLLAALEELRTLGTRQEIAERIGDLPGETQPLFIWILKRLEGDPEFRDVAGNQIGAELVRKFASYIGVSRYGLSYTELAELLAPGDPKNDPPIPADAQGNVAALLRLLRPYLMQRGELLDFFHWQFFRAVEREFIGDDQEQSSTSHRSLAHYFEKRWREPNRHAISELPYHQTQAQTWAELGQTLCDLEFVEAKCSYGMVYDLLGDYTRVEPRWDLHPPVRTAFANAGELVLFCPCCTVWYSIREEDLGGPVACPGCNLHVTANAFAIRGHGGPTDERLWSSIPPSASSTPLSRDLLVFARFVRSQAHIFVKRPHLVLQQALNQPVDSALALAAEKALPRLGRPILVRTNKPRSTDACSITLVGHKAAVTNCAFSADGRYIVSASYDRTLRVWDSQNGQEVARFAERQPVRACTFSRDTRHVVSVSGRTATIRAIASGEVCARFRGGLGRARACAYSLDGRLLAFASGRSVVLVDPVVKRVVGWLPSHLYGVNCLAFSPGGAQLVSAAGWPEFELWPMGQLIIWSVHDRGKPMILKGHRRSVNACAFSPDGQRIVSGSGWMHPATPYGEVMVWDAVTGQCLACLPHGDMVVACDVSPDGRTIMSGSHDGTVVLWDAKTFQRLGSLQGRKLGMRSCAFSPDGERIVTSGGTQLTTLGDTPSAEMTVWSVDALRQTEPSAHASGVRGCQFSPDGMRVLSSNHVYPGELAQGVNGKLVEWDSQNGVQIVKQWSGNASIDCMSLSTDNRHISIVTTRLKGLGRVIPMWDFGGWASEMEIRDVESRACTSCLPLRCRRGVDACSYSPDGRQLALAASNGLSVVDVHTSAAKTTRRSTEAYTCSCVSCDFSPDGRLVSSGYLQGKPELDVWDALTCARVVSFPPAGIPRESLMSAPGCQRFSPNGRQLIAAYGFYNRPGFLSVWDLATGHVIATWQAHGDWVTHCSHSQDGQMILSTSRDQSLLLWSASTFQEIAYFPASRQIGAGALGGVGRDLAFGDGSGNLIFLKLLGLEDHPAIVTPVRRWGTGKWDTCLSVRCPWCGVLSPAETRQLDVIGGIARTAGLTVEQAPCLRLPVEAWDEPMLKSKCQHCDKPLKYNPFVADNKDWYLSGPMLRSPAHKHRASIGVRGGTASNLGKAKKTQHPWEYEAYLMAIAGLVGSASLLPEFLVAHQITLSPNGRDEVLTGLPALIVAVVLCSFTLFFGGYVLYLLWLKRSERQQSKSYHDSTEVRVDKNLWQGGKPDSSSGRLSPPGRDGNNK